MEIIIDNDDYDEKAFTLASVECLAKMKQLKFLHITVVNYRILDDAKIHQQLMLVDIAGQVPQLKKVDFEIQPLKNCWSFFELYGQHYPEKKLLIHQLK